MNTLMVADVGNSRIKWGRCDERRVADTVSLPLDAVDAWEERLHAFAGTVPVPWAVAGVNPDRMDRFLDWLGSRATSVARIDHWSKLPIQVAVDHPDQVGIDRLLNAVAARSRQLGGQPAILIDAGSAVTVDWLDGAGVFRGGAIFPGVRLMTRALHSYTAKLPFVEITPPVPPMPGSSTPTAIAAGVYGAMVGGIERLARDLASHSPTKPVVWLTGGDAELLAPGLPIAHCLWPSMTLEGIRLAALSKP